MIERLKELIEQNNIINKTLDKWKEFFNKFDKETAHKLEKPPFFERDYRMYIEKHPIFDGDFKIYIQDIGMATENWGAQEETLIRVTLHIDTEKNGFLTSYYSCYFSLDGKYVKEKFEL